MGKYANIIRYVFHKKFFFIIIYDSCIFYEKLIIYVKITANNFINYKLLLAEKKIQKSDFILFYFLCKVLLQCELIFEPKCEFR